MDQVRADAAFAKLAVPSNVESVRAAAAFLVEAARRMGAAAAAEPTFELAVVEALNNAVKHGNAGQPGAVIVCEIQRGDRALTICIFDQGPGFDLARVPVKTATPIDIASTPESGYGLSIIHSVFPTLRTIARDGKFGVEMSMPV